jgi:hypothetical protein
MLITFDGLWVYDRSAPIACFRAGKHLIIRSIKVRKRLINRNDEAQIYI